MNFLNNFLLSLRKPSTTPPDSLSTQPTYTAPAIEKDWEFVCHLDRITIYTGAQSKEYCHVLIADIPKSSFLLRLKCNAPPAERTLYIAHLNVPMIMLYLQHTTTTLNTLAMQVPWLDIINLAITAEVLKDFIVLEVAQGALRQKGILADAPGNGLGWFSSAEYAVARKFNVVTLKGEELMALLDALQAKRLVFAKDVESELKIKWQPSNKEVPVAVAKAKQEREEQVDLRALASGKTRGFKHSMLKVRRGVPKKQGLDLPCRQPVVPPTVEQVVTGEVVNFLARRQ